MYHPLIRPNITIREFKEAQSNHVSLVQILGPGVIRTSYIVTVRETPEKPTPAEHDKSKIKVKDSNKRFWSLEKAQEYFEFQTWRLHHKEPVVTPTVVHSFPETDLPHLNPFPAQG